jgi:hypothetical protein
MQYILLLSPLVLKKLIYITVFTAFLDREGHVYIQKICQERQVDFSPLLGGSWTTYF